MTGLSKNQVASELQMLKLQVNDLLNDVQIANKNIATSLGFSQDLEKDIEEVISELDTLAFKVKAGIYDEIKGLTN